MDIYLTLFAALIALLAIGICLGLLWQWLMSSARIRALELQRNDAHHEMVAQEWCCDRLRFVEQRVPELEARIAELERVLADLDDDEDIDYDDWLEDDAVLNWNGATE